jgi:hypothetical protein
MNLQSIVSTFIATVNPQQLLTVQVSAGSVEGPSGARIPIYKDPVQIYGQVQPMSYNDILQADSLNIQGTRAKFYLNGRVEGLMRGKQEGGDTITMPDGQVWLVVLVTEAWPDWTSGIVTLQDGS